MRRFERCLEVVLFLCCLSRCSAQASSNSTCPGVRLCNGQADCRTCLAAVSIPATTGDGETSFAQRNSEAAFFHSLSTTPTCRSNGTNVTELATALAELSNHGDSPGCPGVKVFYGACAPTQLACFRDTHCRGCLVALLEQPHRSAALLTSSTCAMTSPLLNNVYTSCFAFPGCTYAKLTCRNTIGCGPCLDRLEAGDAAGAAQLCTTPNASVAINNLINACAGGPVACTFSVERCAQNAGCQSCFAAMGHAASVEAIVDGLASPACAEALGPGLANRNLQELFNFCSAGTMIASQCIQAVGQYATLVDDVADDDANPFAGEVTMCLNGTASPESALCAAIAANCQVCSPPVGLINRIVLATSIIGGVSVVACVWVILAIVGYGKDRLSLRYRVIIGLMCANIVYSSANAIPINRLKDDVFNCGHLALSFETIRFGRAWWFAGKFALLGFEWVILGAAIRALLWGSWRVAAKTEVAMHSGCLLLGLAAFVGFYARCSEINKGGYNAETQTEAQTGYYSYVGAADDLDDDSPQIGATNRFVEARQQYDGLVQAMLQVWATFLGVTIALWLYLRWQYRRATRHNSVALADASQEWDEVLWGESGKAQRVTKTRIFTLVQEGIDEIAKPLEPFVVVFVAFGVPAIVMATDYCQKHSAAEAHRSEVTYNPSLSYGTCDVWCELALAFRSLATVVVYFYQREHRIEVANAKTLGRRLSSRIRRALGANAGTVQFQNEGLEHVRMIPQDGTEGGPSGEAPYLLLGDDCPATASALRVD
eukprot:m.354855 g.354855  ORF g.354855 m.354855 type:complete len:772 (-) comp16596_c0_seq3:195-2510(-)